MFKGLRTVVCKVGDLERAKKWYATALGIEPYFDEPFYVGFNVGGYELGLDPDMTNAAAGTTPVAYWGVDDCRGVFGRLVELGARPHAEPEEVGGGIIAAAVLDPFNNVLGIIENPHFRLEGTG